jgi:hypothetical protein
MAHLKVAQRYEGWDVAKKMEDNALVLHIFLTILCSSNKLNSRSQGIISKQEGQGLRQDSEVREGGEVLELPS